MFIAKMSPYIKALGIIQSSGDYHDIKRFLQGLNLHRALTALDGNSFYDTGTAHVEYEGNITMGFVNIALYITGRNLNQDVITASITARQTDNGNYDNRSLIRIWHMTKDLEAIARNRT